MRSAAAVTTAPPRPRRDHRLDAAAFAAGGNACNPRILGIGADSGHHEAPIIKKTGMEPRLTVSRRLALATGRPAENSCLSAFARCGADEPKRAFFPWNVGTASP
jgi:hypothetical protein